MLDNEVEYDDFASEEEEADEAEYRPRSSAVDAASQQLRKHPPYIVIRTVEEAKADLKRLRAEVGDDNVYGLDSEDADPKNPNRLWEPLPGVKRQIVTLQYYSPTRKQCVVIYGNVMHVYRAWLEDPTVRKVFTNGKSDLPKLEEHGIKVQGIVGDTVTMDWHYDENRFEHGLESTAFDHCRILKTGFAKVFGYFIPKRDGSPSKKRAVADLWDVISQKHPYCTATLKDFHRYAASDPWMTYEVYLFLRKQLKKRDGGATMPIWRWYMDWELPFTWALKRMEPRGIKLDQPHLAMIDSEVTAEQGRVETVFRDITGKGTFNLRSDKQKGLYFFGKRSEGNLQWPVVVWGKPSRKTGDRNPSLNATALSIYIEKPYNYELARYLKDHKRVSTMKSNFTTGLLHKVSFQGDGVARTIFKQTGTKTGRISSGDAKADPPMVNLLNIPIRDEKDPYGIRRAFVARNATVVFEGQKYSASANSHLLLCKDYSGIELVGMAEFSHDPIMEAAILRGENLHARTACELFGLKYPKIELGSDGKVTPKYKEWLARFKEEHDAEYSAGKITNFSLNYGMGAYTYAGRLDIDEEEAQRRIDEYFKLYKGVKRWCKEIIRFCREYGYVLGITGQRRHVPFINAKDEKHRGHAERQAMNAPIQNYNAMLMKVAMVLLDRMEQSGEIKSKMLVQVYDELVLETPDSYLVQKKGDKKPTPAGIILEEHPKITKTMTTDTAKILKLRLPISVGGAIGPNWKDAKAA